MENSPYKADSSNVTVSSVSENNPLPAADVPKEVDMWYYTSTLNKSIATEDSEK